jgi:hypothetical protein
MKTADTSDKRLSAAAIAALQMGNKIEAIKIVRSERGLDLKDAKNAVDVYIDANPALQEQLLARTNVGALSWIAMLLLAIAAIVYFWPR